RRRDMVCSQRSQRKPNVGAACRDDRDGGGRWCAGSKRRLHPVSIASQSAAFLDVDCLADGYRAAAVRRGGFRSCTGKGASCCEAQYPVSDLARRGDNAGGGRASPRSRGRGAAHSRAAAWAMGLFDVNLAGEMLLGYNTNGLAHHDPFEAIELLAEIGYQ